MPSRRGGKKSHHGCANCKRRHLKCDEVSPTCGRCSKRGDVCVRTYSPFRHTAATTDEPLPKARISRIHAISQKWDNYAANANGSAAASDVSREATPISATTYDGSSPVTLPYICSRLADVTVDVPDVPLDDDGDWLDDMLFKHYRSVVCSTLNEDARVVQLFRELVPELASEYAQIRHAALAISGAHCVAALTRQSETTQVDSRTIHTLIERTLHHSSKALSTFAQQVFLLQQTDEISSDDGVVATMASIMILTNFLAQLHPALQDYSAQAPGGIDKAVAMLNLEGPIAGFFARYADRLRATQLRVYFDGYMPKVEDGAAIVPEGAGKGLDAVGMLCEEEQDADYNTYAAAVAGLRQKHLIVALQPNTIGGRFGWLIGDEAAAMANAIHRRQPKALLLLAFWAACFIPWQAWWGDDFARRLILEIEQTLPAQYIQYMDWPRECVDHGR